MSISSPVVLHNFGGLVRFTTACYDITVDEERAERIISKTNTAWIKSGGLYQFVSREQDAVQQRYVPAGVMRRSLRHQQWLYLATMTDRRERSDRVYPSHVRLHALWPRLYTSVAGQMKPKTIEAKLRLVKVGSPGQSATYWPRSAETLFTTLNGDPKRLYEFGSGRIDDVLAFKRSAKIDPIPGFGPKILSLYSFYLHELGLIDLPDDAFPVDIHVQRFLISTGIVRGTGVIVNEQLEQITRPLLCRVADRLGIARLELSHAIWFLGNRCCSGCWRKSGIPELCPAYAECGGAIDSKSYFKKGVWHFDPLRNPRGGDVQAVLPWSIPIRAVA